MHQDPVKAQQAEAAAEMLLDFAECMMTQKDHLHRGFEGWRKYYQTLLTESPTLRKFWKANEQWFQDDLRQVINDILRNIPKH